MSPVFYRKWRPQAFADVAGQELVTRTLQNAVKSGRLSHAYLFCGTRGTGKTSTGRILAKAVNCLSDGKGEPCNTCAMCQAVSEGRALDVIEIDAASNRGIDDVRELREKVNYAPSQARYKVYIIDEVHMLSKDASNALLKTLEEPPPHVIFILATTEAHRLLPTILSRCQRFDFKRLSRNDVVGKLSEISQAEGISIEPEGLRLIARAATGSLRDAENLLELLTTYFGARIDIEQIRSVLGIASDERVKELAGYIIEGNLPKGMAAITSMDGGGADLRQFNRQLVEYLRELLLVKSGAEDAVDATAEDVAELKTLASRTTLPLVLRAVKCFGELDSVLDNYSTLPLELALVDATQSEEKAASVQAAPRAAVPPPPAKPAAPIRPPAPKPPPAKPVAAAAPVKPPIAKVAEPVKPAATPPEVKPESAPAEVPITPQLGTEFERLSANWRQVIDKAPANVRKSAVLAVLRSGVTPVSIEGEIVVLASDSSFFVEQLEKAENQKTAVEIISNFLGHPCKVRCVHRPKSSPIVRAALRAGAQITGEVKKP